jgi:hypothetical protein
MAPAMVIGALPLVSMILIVALGLALFPIGPLWVLTAWLLHRSQFTARWVYALAGAFVAVYLPLFPLFASLLRGSNLGDAPFYAAWFALAGGVGGYVSGRALRRT